MTEQKQTMQPFVALTILSIYLSSLHDIKITHYQQFKKTFYYLMYVVNWPEEAKCLSSWQIMYNYTKLKLAMKAEFVKYQ